MCGIVGVCGNLFYKEEKTMQALLLNDYFRGVDSTGMAAVRMNGDVKIAKIASDPITLFQMNKFKDALNGNMSKAFIGHNRASTSGGTNNFNAHPYQFDHITGVQNGTLEYGCKTKLEDVVGEKFEVDSQALFAAVAKIGIKDTISLIREGSDSQRGAWALVWYDQKEDTINFLRNKHRPLWLGWEKGFKRLFFASMWRTIEYSCYDCVSQPYEFETYERKDKPGEFYRFFQLPENQHLKFNLSEISKGSESRPKPIQKEIKGKEPYQVSKTAERHVWDPFPSRGSGSQVKTKVEKSSSSTMSCRSGEQILHLFGSGEAPYANVLGARRFSELVQESGNGTMTGCSFCYRDIPFGSKITVYEQQDVILCDKCSGLDTDKSSVQARIYVSPKEFEILRKAA